MGRPPYRPIPLDWSRPPSRSDRFYAWLWEEWPTILLAICVGVSLLAIEIVYRFR